MPLYEYECESCGQRVEKIHGRFSDPPLEICPACGGPLKKLLSSPAIQFKGSGWYITDYAKKSPPDATKADSTKTSSDSSSETKSDTSTGSSSTSASDSPKKD